MTRLVLSCCLAFVALAFLAPAAPASQSRPARPRVPTVRQALVYLGGSDVRTREQFRRWTGLKPADGAVSTRWRLADGVLVTNYMEFAPGRLAIACWQVEKK